MSPYRHVPHPHILHRKAARPAKVADQFSRGSAIERFNTAFALKITAGVGSMWCAYITNLGTADPRLGTPCK
jgi:hypothetical protein